MKPDKLAVFVVVMIVAGASGLHAGVALAGPGNAPDNAGDRGAGDDRGHGGPPDAAEEDDDGDDDDDRRDRGEDRDTDDDRSDRGNRGNAPGASDRADRGRENAADASNDDDDRGPDRKGPPFGNDGPPFGNDGPPFGNDGPPFGNDGPPFGNDGEPGFGNAEGPPTDMPASVPDHVAKIHQTIRDFLTGVLDGIGNTVSDIASGNNPSNDAADGS